MEQISPKNKVFIDWLKEHMGHNISWSPFFQLCKPDNVVFVFICVQCDCRNDLIVTSQTVKQWFEIHKEHRKRWRIITFKQDISLMVACECGEKYTIKISE